jgi:hypothetical protein
MTNGQLALVLILMDVALPAAGAPEVPGDNISSDLDPRCIINGVKTGAERKDSDYQWRGDRCEGFTGAGHGQSNGLSWVSLTRWSPSKGPALNAGRPDDLLLRWPASASEKVNLRIATTAARYHFQMDIAQRAGRYLWPQRYVRALGEDAWKSLFYLARVDGSYRPVLLESAGATDEYAFIFQVSEPVSHLKARIELGDSAAKNGCSPRPGATAFRREATIQRGALTVSIDPSKLPCPGPYRVVVEGVDAGGQTVKEKDGSERPATVVLDATFLHGALP